MFDRVLHCFASMLLVLPFSDNEGIADAVTRQVAEPGGVQLHLKLQWNKKALHLAFNTVWMRMHAAT